MSALKNWCSNGRGKLTLCIPLFLLLLSSSGCIMATLTATPARVPVNVPKGTQVQLVRENGGRFTLPIRSDGDGEEFVEISESQEATPWLEFEYFGSVRILKATRVINPWLLLDLPLLMGVPIDDFTGAYAVHEMLSPDFSSRTPDTVRQPLTALQEFYSMDRPRLIAGAAFGFTNAPLTQAVLGPAMIQLTFGINYRRFEALGVRTIAVYSDPFPQSKGLYADPTIASYQAVARYYVAGKFYGEAGYGLARVGADHASRDTTMSSRGAQITYGAEYERFPTISLGIGAAGDVGYIGIQQIFGLRKIALFGSGPFHFNVITMSMGIHFRL